MERMPLLKTLTAITGMFGSGRSPALLLNLVAPRRGYKVARDIAYGEGPRGRLDLYIPDSLQAPAPVVLFFYGGAFQAGWKNEYRIVGEALASAGLIVAVADYRIHPHGRYPDFLQDGAKAFAALRRIAASHGGDPERIFLAGHSAGAYIAVMLALDARYVRAEGEDVAAIRGVIGIAGPYDFLPIVDPTLIEIFGGPNRPETQPVHYANGKKPPMLLATGANDGRVQVKSTRNLSALLRAAGSDVQERIYPDVGHMGIILALAPPFRRRAPLREDIVRFVESH
jgi:acetyl esterase/lipase